MTRIKLFMLFSAIFLAITAGFLGVTYFLDTGQVLQELSCEQRVITQETGEIWEGNADPKLLTHPATTRIEKSGDAIQVRSIFSRRPGSGGMTGGVRYRIDALTEKQVAGQNITVKVDVCGKKTHKKHIFAAAYSTASVGNSGWKRFVLKPGRNSYCFRYKVPVPGRRKFNGADYLGILADFSGKGRPLLLHRAQIYPEDIRVNDCFYK